MFSASSAVVGLIEIDHTCASRLEQPHSPSHDRSSTTGSPLAQIVAASDDDDVITADLRQLKRELRTELAYIIARLRRAARP